MHFFEKKMYSTKYINNITKSDERFKKQTFLIVTRNNYYIDS